MHTLRFANDNYIYVKENGSYDLKLGDTGILNCFPSLDEKLLTDAEIILQADKARIVCAYRTADFTLTLCWKAEKDYLSLVPELSDLKRQAVEKL